MAWHLRQRGGCGEFESVKVYNKSKPFTDPRATQHSLITKKIDEISVVANIFICHMKKLGWRFDERRGQTPLMSAV
jgi:hypothetical protein